MYFFLISLKTASKWRCLEGTRVGQWGHLPLKSHRKYIYMWSNSHWKQAEGPQNNTFTTKAVKKDPQSQAEKEEKQSSWNLPLFRMKQSMEGKYKHLDILSGK